MGKIALGIVSLFLLAGCSNLAYYTQAAGGHLELMSAARPIRDLVAEPTLDPALKKRLENVTAIREFASRDLGLPDNDSYRTYADLGRPFVVWNVFAAPEFSLKPEQWCMLIVGCVSYRGYYDRDEAMRLAAELRLLGMDTHVAGVPAYSTLGFFNDPVLNTFMRHGDIEVARLMFHELAHQLVYAEGDSVFNESFATAVEREGVQRWLARNATPQQAKAFAAHQQRKEQFGALVALHRGKLADLYAGTLPVAAKRKAKAQVIADLKSAYADLKASWGGFPGFDPWIAQDLNNAKLGSAALYTQLVPAFEALLAAEGNDLPSFYRRAAELARLPGVQRVAALNDYLPAKRMITLADRGTSARLAGTPQ